MKYLAKTFSIHFKRGGKYDGLMFERLVRDLLGVIYPGNWRSTPASWDGAKDFVLADSESRTWAECKMHSKSVSIRTLSPTLVMAILDDVNLLIFFSFSRLNRNTVRYLCQFQDTTAKKIEIFDDATLETLILSCPEVLAKYFAETDPMEPAIQGLSVDCKLSKDPDIAYTYTEAGEYREPLEPRRLMTLSTFCIDVFLRSTDVRHKHMGNIVLIRTSIAPDFLLMNEPACRNDYVVPFEISGPGVFFQRLFFKALRGGKAKQLPSFSVFSAGKLVRHIRLGKADVSSLFSPPLIGNSYISILEKFRLKAFDRDVSSLFEIYGASGAGKTRLISEFRDVLFAHSFSVHVFNGEAAKNATATNLIRKLISRLYRLPLSPSGPAKGRGYSTSSSSASNRGQDSLLYKILYDPAFDLSQDIEVYREFLYSSLMSGRNALVIDNLQSFDDQTVCLISWLAERIQDQPGRLVLIVVLNTDLALADTEAKLLHGRLLDLSIAQPDQFTSTEVTGFSPDDARVFLNHLLGGEAADGSRLSFCSLYPETTRLFLRRVLLRPLFIEQTLLYLEDVGALTRSPGDASLAVSDPDLFHQTLAKLPRNLSLLLERRWARVMGRVSSSAFELVRFLTFFASAPSGLFVDLGYTPSDLRVLEEAGIIRVQDDQNVEFYHGQIFQFFSDKYPEISNDDALRVIELLELSRTETEYPCQYFLAKERCGQLTTELIAEAASLTIRGDIYNELLLRYSRSLFKVVKREGDILDVDTQIRVIHSLCEVFFVRQDFSAAFSAYENSCKFLVKRPRRIRQNGEAYFSFIFDLANAAFSVHQDVRALHVLEQTVDEVDSFSFASERQRGISLGLLLNRMSVAYNWMYLESDALTCAQQCLKIAESYSDPALAIRAHIDLGHIWEGKPVRRNEMLKEWSLANDIFENQRGQHSSIRRYREMVKFYWAQVLLASGRIQEGLDVIAEDLQVCRVNLKYFYGVKLLILRVVAILTNRPSNADLTTLDQEINQAIDWCISFRANRSYWAVLFAKAKLRLAQGRIPEALECYNSSLDQLIRTIKDPALEEYYAYFFVDLVLAFQLHGRSRPHHIERLCGSARERVNQILSMDEDEVLRYASSFVPTSTFNDGKSNFPNP